MKDVGVTQLTQHPAGMFPQGYLLPNGHAATAEFVQAQAAAQVKCLLLIAPEPALLEGNAPVLYFLTTNTCACFGDVLDM